MGSTRDWAGASKEGALGGSPQDPQGSVNIGGGGGLWSGRSGPRLGSRVGERLGWSRTAPVGSPNSPKGFEPLP